MTIALEPSSITDPFHLLDYEYSQRRRQLFAVLIVVGLSCLVALTMLVKSSGVPSLEAHLRNDVTKSIANDVTDLRVAVDGQKITVSGTVRTQRERTRIVERVRTRWGVRRIDAARLVVK
jgi:BON domain